MVYDVREYCLSWYEVYWGNQNQSLRAYHLWGWVTKIGARPKTQSLPYSIQNESRVEISYQIHVLTSGKKECYYKNYFYQNIIYKLLSN